MSLLLSIIVPVYNVEKYLCQCIESILSQSFQDFELILIDDGSSDKSGEICETYAKRDLRIKVIHQENQGLSTARNRGLEAARGAYIGFVDSDDWLHEDMYKCLMALSSRYQADIAQCSMLKVSSEEEVYDLRHKAYQQDNGKAVHRRIKHARHNRNIKNHKEDKLCRNVRIEEKNEIKVIAMTSQEALKQIYGAYKEEVVVMCNKIYSRHLFETNRFEVGKIHEDEFMIHKLLHGANKVVVIGQKYYYYRQTFESITRSGFNIKRMDYVEALEQRIDFLRQAGYRDLEAYTKLKYLSTLIQIYMLIGKNQVKDYQLKQSIKKKFEVYYLEVYKGKYINKKEKIKFILFKYIPEVCAMIMAIKQNKFCTKIRL